MFMGLLISTTTTSVSCDNQCDCKCECKHRKKIDIDCVDWVENAELEDVEVQFRIDTGTQANVLPLSLYVLGVKILCLVPLLS